MASIETQIWKSARLTIERGESETHGTVFRLSGPLTGRDMYNSLSPDAFRNIFESPADGAQAPAHVFDLTEVPYMDCCNFQSALYSSRSRIIGSTARAWRAGMLAATRPTASMDRMTPPSTIGSFGVA
jgi:hypothetical protein